MDAGAGLDRAVAHLLARQSPRGDWEGEMVWCPMISAQYVIVHRIVGRPVGASTRAGLLRYFEGTRTADGAWGLHPESPGYVFVTTLAYVALRVLGLERDEPLVKDARAWLQRAPGGVLAIPTWGKFWLALCGLYGWNGVSPILPELVLLPRWLPVHPDRLYCHTRAIYLAMAYLYGRRTVADLGPLGAALGAELFGVPMATIDFPAHRHEVAPSDLLVAPGRALRLAADVLAALERWLPAQVRRRALARCLDRILDEQRLTRYQALSPVNGLLDCLAIWAADPRHPDLAPSLEGLEAWRWADGERIRYVGARSNSWDTAFALRALAEACDRRADESPGRGTIDALTCGSGFLAAAQMTEELPRLREAAREPILGGWCFSDGSHRWPVSDCTAEAVSALLTVEARSGTPPVATPERLRQAAAFILARQNRDGGFGTYEARRGPVWLERLNPSEMFGQCMVEGSYVECTASCIEALAHLAARDTALARGVQPAIAAGTRFLLSRQRSDGSVPAAWGINFTYGAFHFVKGLRAAGVSREDPALARAARWLVAHQRADGGWGEHWSGCREARYVEHPESQPVMTAWALLALLEVVAGDDPVVLRGVQWLLDRQRPDGGWPHGAVNGVFFGSAMLDYRLYPSYFPAWALARYVARATSSP